MDKHNKIQNSKQEISFSKESTWKEKQNTHTSVVIFWS